MKQWKILGLLCLALLLCGCQRQAVQEGSLFAVALQWEGDIPLYGVRVEYYLDQQPVGGQEVWAHPKLREPFSAGADVTFQFLEQNFPEGVEGKTFGLAVFAVLEGGEELLAQGLCQWRATAGETYPFVLSLGGTGQAHLKGEARGS